MFHFLIFSERKHERGRENKTGPLIRSGTKLIILK